MLLLPDENEIKKILLKVYNFLVSIKLFSLDEKKSSISYSYSRNEEFQKWLNSKENNSDSTKNLIFKILDLNLNKPEKYEEFLSLIGDDGLGVIKLINVTPYEIPVTINKNAERQTDTIYFVNFCPSEHERFLTFEDLSFGTKRIIEFILSLIYDTYSVALVEQIEDGIHEGLIYKLIQLIRDYSEDSQFILTSHATSVFNRLEPSEIRLVELKSGKTEVRKLSQVEIKAANNYMAEDGPLSDFIQGL